MRTVLETTPGCNATPRILFAMEEIGDPCDVEVKDDGHFLGTYGVPGPALVEDGFRLFEGNPILRHLARTRSPGSLMPSDPRAQAEVDRWLDFLVVRVGMSVVHGKMDAAARYLRVLDDTLAGREWICGDFTIADCGFVTLASLQARLPMGDRPHLLAYLDRLVARPAWARARRRIGPGPGA